MKELLREFAIGIYVGAALLALVLYFAPLPSCRVGYVPVVRTAWIGVPTSYSCVAGYKP